jgi:hypothetical protein
MNSNLLQDLIPNLISSVFEIIITVFVIDRLVSKKEEKRWRPTKLLLFVNLLEIQDRLLFELLPNKFLKPQIQSYRFGDLTGVTTYEIVEFSSPAIQEELRKRAEAISNVIKNTLDVIAARLDSLMVANAHVIEPDLLHLLLGLDRALDRLRSFQANQPASLTEMEREDLRELFERVIVRSLDIRTWVLNKATRTKKQLT